MKRYRLTLLAIEDLDRIDDTVAELFGEDAATKAVARLEETFEMLAQQPHVGRPRPEWTKAAVLFWPVPGTPTLVIYRDTNPLEVVRLWDARQNPRRVGRAIETE